LTVDHSLWKVSKLAESGEQLTAQRQQSCTVDVREKAEAPNAHEIARQLVQQEAG
jgi:hypothetical protein